MTAVFRGPRPDLTPAQSVGMLVAAVPIIASLLRAFGVYELTPDQQEALTNALTWCGVTAGVLFASDAGLRAARNAGDARRDVAAMSAPGEPHAEVPATDEEAAGFDDDLSVGAGNPELAALLGPESGTVPDSPETI